MKNVKELNRVCPICGSKTGYFLHNVAMKLPEKYPIPGGYDVVSCVSCGFTYADVDANQADYNKYYANYNMYSLYSSIRDKLTEVNNRIRMEVFTKYIPKEAAILDIGCGGGDFLETLSSSGYKNLTGIDPSEISVNRIKTELGFSAIVGNIFDEAPEGYRERFDVICCTMVGEHIYDLQRFVHQLVQYVKKDGGMVFIDVPCVEGFEKYLRNPANYFNHEHINYFSLYSLDNLFASQGCRRKSTDEESRKLLDIEQPEIAIEAIYVVSDKEKDISFDKTLQVKRDIVSERSILNYFTQIEEIEARKIDEIKRFIYNDEGHLVVWGTGSYCMHILEVVKELKESVEYFIDNNITKQGGTLAGIPIVSPAKLRELTGNIKILILVMQQSQDVMYEIEEMGIECKIIVG